MSTPLKLSALAVALLLSMSAQATIFNFSYTSGNGHVTTGSFSGTANGQYVDGVTDVSVFFDGIAFVGNGSLFSHAGICSPWPNCAWTTNPGVVSFSGALNNFMFVDTNYPVVPGYINYFAFSNVNPLGPVVQTLGPSFDVYEYPANPSTWAVTEASSVPEPATLSLLALGLLGIGAARRSNR